MVPYPAGGPSDAIARIFTVPLGKELGQQVLVENLGGVSGALAAQKVLAAPADGHYLFQGSPNEVILSPLANAAVKLKAEDFRLVHPVADAVMVFVARKDLPANSVDELIALARKSGRQAAHLRQRGRRLALPPDPGERAAACRHQADARALQGQCAAAAGHRRRPGGLRGAGLQRGHGRAGRAGPAQGDRPARRAALRAAEERADRRARARS